MSTEPRILVIDNYDSFTYNLVHLLEQLKVPIEVRRNDAILIDEVGLYSHILISPGPGVPAESGIVPKVIQHFRESRSIFAVCLGMQCLLEHEGVELVNMPRVQHGAQERLSLKPESRLFHGLPEELQVGRYHSWAFRPNDVPTSYSVTAVSEDNYVMAIEHAELPLYGVQFHPESIMTEYGLEMVQNWLKG